jgi:tRNA (guanine-N7-)-methyltransferase
MDWSIHYPAYFPSASEPSTTTVSSGKQVEWADVGCGFGGLLMDLAPKFPDVLMLGMSPSPLLQLGTQMLLECFEGLTVS